MTEQPLEVRGVEHRVHHVQRLELTQRRAEMPADPLLRNGQIPRRGGLTRRPGEIHQHIHGKRPALPGLQQLHQVFPQLVVRHVRRLHHEDDAAEGAVHPVRHGLLGDVQQAGDHFLPLP